jgi:acetoin:2,6-dichlorophenolindophenol oxidoreductase subunit alpha
VVPNTSDRSAQVASDLLCQSFKTMLLARILDEKFASLYRAGKIHGGVFLGRGQEALSVAVGGQLRKGDAFAPLIRDQAGRLAFGETVIDAARTYMGSALGPMRGRDGNVHRGRPKSGYLPMISHLGSTIAVVNGVLFAKRMKGETGFAGAAVVGDGATSTGAFHEALNQAAVEHLPLVLVVANNQFAYSTPTNRQFACESISAKAAGYGVQAHRVAGNDLLRCLEVCGRAIEQARSGGGPQLIEADLLRLCGHGEHDDANYITPEQKNSPLGRDCLKVGEQQLLDGHHAAAADLGAWREAAVREVDEVIARVQREPAPDAYQEDWCALASRHLQETHSHPED